MPHSGDPDDDVTVDFNKTLEQITGYSTFQREKIVYHDIPDREERNKVVRSQNPSPIRVQYLEGHKVKVIIPVDRFMNDFRVVVDVGKKKMKIETTVITVSTEEGDAR